MSKITGRDQNNPCDMLIIGGGINGCGIACDATGRGLSVILCEKDDLGGATSSASSKLIHGGLRYLEHYEFRLVREALAEREVLLKKAAHLIRPMRFILPHSPDLRPAWLIRLGLFLYDQLGGARTLAGTKTIKFAKHMAGKVLKKSFKRGFVYSDCAVDDARLVILNALSAAAKGAEILTRHEVVFAKRIDKIWRVVLRDNLTAAEKIVYTHALVNAAGPWVLNVIKGVDGIRHDQQIRLVKGSHIIVPKIYEGPEAFILQNDDRRIVFVIPYLDQFSLIGTTDVAVQKVPETIKISDDETKYICQAVNRYFQSKITPNDVISSFSGYRPLYDDMSNDPSKVTRDYVLNLDGGTDQAPILSIFGGKITTYRCLAESALRKLNPFFPNMGKPWTNEAVLPGGDLYGNDVQGYINQIKQAYPAIDGTLISSLVARHGTRIELILIGVKKIDDLGMFFGADLYACEIDYLMKYEWAKSADDILKRRTKTGLFLTGTECLAVDQYVKKHIQKAA